MFYKKNDINLTNDKINSSFNKKKNKLTSIYVEREDQKVGPLNVNNDMSILNKKKESKHNFYKSMNEHDVIAEKKKKHHIKK